MVALTRAVSTADYDPESQIGGNFPEVPAGVYKCMVGEIEDRETKSRNGRMFLFKMPVAEGDFAGEDIAEFVNYDNPSSQAVDIAYQTIEAIAYACGLAEVADTDELVGKSLVVARYNKVDKRTGEVRVNNKFFHPDDLQKAIDAYGDPKPVEAVAPAGGGQTAAPASNTATAPSWRDRK